MGLAGFARGSGLGLVVMGSVGAGAALQGHKVRFIYWDHVEFFAFHSQDIDVECEGR